MNDRRISATMVLKSPMHIGNGETGGAVDAPLNRDAYGRLYIPGTTLAGRLRENATRLAPLLGWEACGALQEPDPDQDARECDCPVCRVFGHRFLPSDEETETGLEHASRVWVFDAEPSTSDGERVIIRDGVGISRRWGASASEARAKFDVEWVAAGTRFELRIELQADAREAEPEKEGVSPGELQELVLALALSEWREGRGHVGAGSARGGGAFELAGLTLERGPRGEAGLDWSAFLVAPGGEGWQADDGSGKHGRPWHDRMLERLQTLAEGAAEPDRLAAGVADDPTLQGFAQVDVDLHFPGSVLVNDPATALVNGVHAAPAFVDGAWERPVLPGSSVRGVLRSHAERIGRTLATAFAWERAGPYPDGGPDTQWVQAALAAFTAANPPCDPFLTEESGHALEACSSRNHRSAHASARPEANRLARCPACTVFGSTDFGSRLWITDGELQGEAVYNLRDFVSIDRFTGGARKGAKFDALTLVRPTFRVRVLFWDPRRWELLLLARTLLDLHQGWTGVGWKGAAGFGRCEVPRVRLTRGIIGGGELPAFGEHGPSQDGASGVFVTRTWEGGAAGLVETIDRAWPEDDACDRTLAGPFAGLDRVAREPGEPSRMPDTDHYFGSGVETLYPVYASQEALDATLRDDGGAP